MISQKVKKWQPFFEIYDGGDRHLDFWLFRFVNVIGSFYGPIN